MALDRQSIQRKDFPLARRGYDQAAVDAHLAGIADELATREATSGGGDTLASSASDHVRAIVQAAETSAAQIRSEAEAEADATRRQAEQHARSLEASSAAMLERLEATRRELDSAIDSLRGATAGIGEHLGPAEDAESEPVHDGPAEDAEPEPVHDGAGGPAVDPVQPVAQAPAAAPVEDQPPPGLEPATAEKPAAPAPAPQPASAPPADDDSEGARLIALNMALNGTPREETAKYLSEHFQLTDRDGLLDEVYSSVGG